MIGCEKKCEQRSVMMIRKGKFYASGIISAISK